MACKVRGLWIFHAENDVRLLLSRRFNTVERRQQELWGDDYYPLPSDEEMNKLFVAEVTFLIQNVVVRT